ncbi:MAG: hypothetical protein LQ346_008815 [Caloplaca aetnensis]|nr:MAG: hypothetical protein LQ346_008815 [Caloplaca aetnensis]
MAVVPNAPSGPSLIAGLTSDIVTIFIGPEKKAFPIHKALLSAKSTFFRGAFEGDFKEATDKSLTLAEDDPNCFARYVLWIYNQVLDPIRHGQDAKPMLDEYCKLFVLADKLGSERLENVCLDVIHTYAASDAISHFDVATIDFVWDNTPDESKLRALLVDMVGWQMDPDTIADLMKTRPEFLHGVLVICSDRSPSRPDVEESPLGQPRCGMYHTHRDYDGPCQEVADLIARKESGKADALYGGRTLTTTSSAASVFGSSANPHYGGFFGSKSGNSSGYLGHGS